MPKKTNTIDTMVVSRPKNIAVNKTGALTKSPVPAMIGSLRANRFRKKVDKNPPNPTPMNPAAATSAPNANGMLSANHFIF
jgi:hypothetical protein